MFWGFWFVLFFYGGVGGYRGGWVGGGGVCDFFIWVGGGGFLYNFVK